MGIPCFEFIRTIILGHFPRNLNLSRGTLPYRLGIGGGISKNKSRIKCQACSNGDKYVSANGQRSHRGMKPRFIPDGLFNWEDTEGIKVPFRQLLDFPLNLRLGGKSCGMRSNG